MNWAATILIALAAYSAPCLQGTARLKNGAAAGYTCALPVNLHPLEREAAARRAAGLVFNPRAVASLRVLPAEAGPPAIAGEE